MIERDIGIQDYNHYKILQRILTKSINALRLGTPSNTTPQNSFSARSQLAQKGSVVVGKTTEEEGGIISSNEVGQRTNCIAGEKERVQLVITLCYISAR